jgi:hypothetical protein
MSKNNRSVDCTIFKRSIFDNQIGIIVDCYNIDNIKATLQKIISDKSIYSTIINNITIYKENNNLYWEDYTPNLLSIFNQ